MSWTFLRPLARLSALVVLSTSQAGFIIPSNTEHLKCPYDTAGDYMRTRPAPIYPDRTPEQEAYFLKPIPKRVHQIWFGAPSGMDTENTSMWQQFASTFGYGYKLWTEQDQTQLRQMMSPELYALFGQFLRLRDYYGASDIARLAILRAQGGTYVDIDIRPPTQGGHIVDLAQLVPMQNIVLMTEKSSRNVIESSLFVANNFIMVAPNHPLIEHLLDTIIGNCTALNEGPIDSRTPYLRVHPMYLTGPFFVSRSLAGVFTTMPFNYAVAYRMREYKPGAN